MPNIHPTAIVSKDAVLADDVTIGPFCIISGHCTLGSGVNLISHVCLYGPAEIGAGTTIYPNAVLGFPAQDFKFKLGMPTGGIKIGANCIIREHATIHAATKPDVPTTISDRVFLMVNSHVGHDAIISNDAILVNNVCCAGHTQVHTKAIVSGNTVIHQFNRVGKFAMVSGCAVVTLDIPPFCLAYGRHTLAGINIIGMRRNGYSQPDIQAVRTAYKEILRDGMPRTEAVEILRERGKLHAPLLDIADFIETSKRGIAVGERKRGASNSEPEIA